MAKSLETGAGRTPPLRRLAKIAVGARTVERAAVVKRYYERFGRRRQTFSSIFAIFAKIFPDFALRRRVEPEFGEFEGIGVKTTVLPLCRPKRKTPLDGARRAAKGRKRSAAAFDAALFVGFSGFVGDGRRFRRIGGSRRRREETGEGLARRRRLQPNEERKSDGEEPETDALRNGEAGSEERFFVDAD